MSKRELIDQIIRHNRTAAPEFLARFAEDELKAYLERVCIVSAPRGDVRIPTALNSRQQLVMG